MKYIGAHVSTAGGVQNSVLNAYEIGASGFALFTKNQRQWNAKPLTSEQITEFKSRMNEYKFSAEAVLPHDSYLINLGSPRKEQLEKSRKAFLDEILRCEQLGLKYLNFHPGAHLGMISEAECIQVIAESINWVHSNSDYLILLLETTAGQGTAIGYRFEQLAEILNLVRNQERVGICVDTAHIFAAGYAINTPEGYEKAVLEIDHLIGLEKVMGFHVNDSKKDLGSRVDRHASLGEGYLGLETFQRILSDKRFDGIPFILETPNPEKWPEEIRLLKKFAGNVN